MEILETVFAMSITGSIIFLIFLLIKPLTKKNFNASWHYRLSIIILIFFVLPIGNFINFSRISNNPISRISQVEIEKPDDLGIFGQIEDVHNIQTNQNIKEEHNEEGYKDEIKYEDYDIVETQNDNSIRKHFNIYFYEDIILYIWLIGMITLFLIKIIPYIKFKSAIFKSSLEVQDIEILEVFNLCKNELNISTNINLKVCQYISSPMLIGIFNPIVLIPNIRKDKKTLKMIFLHELNHYKRKDILIKFFEFLVNIIHWFNPIVYLLLRDMDNYCEYSIDEKVVDKMGIEDRKYYGETILKLLNNSIRENSPLTTAMSSNGKKLKSRLENMLFFKKSSKKKVLISLFVIILIISSGLTIACNIIPLKTVDENDSFVVYIKEDGLYFSYLDNGEETKIQEGEEFSYPIISKSGDYIAYINKDSLYIYDMKNNKYEKIADKMDSYYISYDWIDDKTIAYATNEPGFTIFNASTKERTEHLDEHYYANIRAANKNTIYSRRMGKWDGEENIDTNNGIVEIHLNEYDSQNNIFKSNIIIEERKSTDEMIGYNPIIWDITDDGKNIYIMEKPASGSTSTDGIGIGIYDVDKKTHTDFKDITVLPYKDNLSINPRNNKLIALIEGAGREMILNKEVVLLDIDKDNNYNTIDFMDKNLVAMTPSFTLDGNKLLYSAAKSVDTSQSFDYNEEFKNWEKKPHHIYQYDLKTSKIEKITDGKYFDFMPISISEDSILFSRYKGNGYHSLIKLVNGEEEILVDNILMDYEYKEGYFGFFYGHVNTEKGIDIFLSKKKGNFKNNENNKAIGLVDELYELRGGKIGDNSRVANILGLLKFPEDLEPNGIELFTKEEPYGLQVNFKASTETQMKYIAMSSDDVWKSQSLILLSLIDNLDYIKYAIDDGKENMILSSTNREYADSITMSVLGQKTSDIAKSRKGFKEFYNIFGENNKDEN